MKTETGSFQDNIRRTFIVYSVVPVIAIVFSAIIMFLLAWSAYLTNDNQNDNRAIAQSVDGVLDQYYAMLNDMEFVISSADADVESVKDRIFSILYKRTEDYDDIGNMIVLSPDREALFYSKDYVPVCLIGEEYDNFGVWNRIKKEPNTTNVILYQGNLYVIRGVFRDGRMRYALVFVVPSSVISEAAGSNRYCIITDDNGWIYLSNIQGLADEYGQIDPRAEGKNGYLRIGSQRYICYETGLSKGIKVYTFADINRSFTMIIILIAIIAVIFMAIIFIALRSTATSSEIYTRDVKKIENAFEEVQKGNLDVVLNIDSSREFQTIGNDFNEMITGLKTQIERNGELAQNAAFSQVKQLESQFNPHFLFNTLDNIRFMARIDAAAADKMIVSLSGLLRYSIREMREEVTVREDLEHLQFYLNILQIRFNKRFAYNMNVADDIMDYLIPKLLLQPLLENAVKYGFGDKEKLTVSITGYQMQESIIFVCEDDGVGIDMDTLAQIRRQLEDEEESSSHFGIYNIHRRIRLMYKGDYGLSINSSKGEGTVVRLSLPKREK